MNLNLTLHLKIEQVIMYQMYNSVVNWPVPSVSTFIPLFAKRYCYLLVFIFSCMLILWEMHQSMSQNLVKYSQTSKLQSLLKQIQNFLLSVLQVFVLRLDSVSFIFDMQYSNIENTVILFAFSYKKYTLISTHYKHFILFFLRLLETEHWKAGGF